MISPANGIWTVRVQSKALPYTGDYDYNYVDNGGSGSGAANGLQKFALVITCNGFVDTLVAISDIR